MPPQNNWRDENAILSQKIHYIYTTGILSNITIIAKNGGSTKEFKVHSIFLAMASPVLEKIVGKQLKCNKKSLEIAGIDPDVFESLLEYVYMDEVKWDSFKQACELFKVADKYYMSQLKKLCLSYITSNVNCDTVFFAYEFARSYDIPDLMEKCVAILSEKTSEVLLSPHFTQIQLPTLITILEQNVLNISEINLFRSVEKWIKNEFERKGISELSGKENQQEIYNQIIPKFRFLSMSTQEFSEGPAESRMLTNEQMLAILLNISTRNTSFPMPDGFSMLKRNNVDDCRLYFMWDTFCSICTYEIHESLINIKSTKDILCAGVMIKGQIISGSTEESSKYMEDLEIRLFDMSNLKTVSKTCFKEDIKCDSLVKIEFPSPVNITKGTIYQLGIYLNQPVTRQYECVDLDGCVLCYRGIEFSFKKHLDWTHLIPIYGIILQDP